jgi:hypothetical protein
MTYAEPTGEWTNGAILRRRLAAAAACFAVHGALLLLLISAWAIPLVEPDMVERVQAVVFERDEPPLPPAEPAAEREPAVDRKRGGETGSRYAAERVRESWPGSVPLRTAPVGLPTPKFELARPTPVPLGGGFAAGSGPAGRFGAGSGSGTSDGSGTAAEGAGAVGSRRELTTSWAPSMQMWQLHRYYPRGALKRGEAGLALLECEVVRGDRVRDCTVKGAAPAGAGFGEAALRAERIYRVHVHDRDGNRVYNERVIIRAFFQPRREPG